MKPRNHSLLDRENAVLIVVDMQEPFLRHIERRDELISNCRLLLSAAAILQIPVITTVQYREKMGELIPALEEVFSENVAPAIDKTSFSAAAVQQFTDDLISSRREQVVLCGVETHICVAQTALDLVHLDYQVHCVADAVSSTTLEKHKLGMEKMRDLGVLPASAEGAVMELLFEAGTSEFKALLKLIK